MEFSFYTWDPHPLSFCNAARVLQEYSEDLHGGLEQLEGSSSADGAAAPHQQQTTLSWTSCSVTEKLNSAGLNHYSSASVPVVKYSLNCHKHHH